jgi:hypothetical protein
MEDATSLRRQAERALRLSKAVSDEQASDALTDHAAALLERAVALENEAAHAVQQRAPEQKPAAQQQQQFHPKKEDK